MAVHPLWRPFAPGGNAGRQGERVAHRQVGPGPLGFDHTAWASEYERVRLLIGAVIPDEVLHIAHTGSTAVPGLLAKPVLDVDLTVRNVTDEGAYLPSLEVAGFRLIFRDHLAGEPHRQLTLGHPNTNLHVWNPGAVEPRRHALFASWLRSNPTDRHRYAAVKREAVAADGTIRYNDLKAAVVYDIYERAFLADPAHPHGPHPRAGTGVDAG